MLFEAQEDVDVEDVVYIEKLQLPHAGLDDETAGTSYSAVYCRLANGRMSDGVDLAEWVDSFASSVYTANGVDGVDGLLEFFDRYIIISDGKIYIFQYAYGNDNGWMTTSGLTLDEIAVVNDDMIQLSFSFTDYGIGVGYGYEETGYFTVTMSNREGGWKIDNFDEYGRFALINQLFRNECLEGDEVPDLLTQIENYLSEDPIS